jgi:hypothetical protein
MNNIFLSLLLKTLVVSNHLYSDFKLETTESSQYLYSEDLAREYSEHNSYSKSRDLCYNLGGDLLIKTINSPYFTKCSVITDQDQFKYKCEAKFISYCRVYKKY